MEILRYSLVGFSLCVAASAVDVRMDAPTLYKSALAAFNVGNCADTVRLLAEFDERYANEPDMSNAMPKVLYVLGCARFNLKQMDAALDAFERHSALDPRSMWHDDIMMRIAAAHQALGQFDEAQRGYGQLLAAAPNAPNAADIQFQIAACLVARNQFTNAVPILRSLTRVRDAVLAGAAEANLLHCLMECNRYDEALGELQEIVRRDGAPDYPVFLNTTALTLGDNFHDNFEYDKSLAAYSCVLRRDEVLRRQTVRLDALNKRRAALAAITAPDVARQAERSRLDTIIAQAGLQVKELESRTTLDLVWLMRLGRCYYDMGSLWEACIAFREALDAFPDSDSAVDARASLVFCLNQMRLYNSARAEIDALLAKHPAHEKAPLMGFLKAESFINEEQYDKAEAELKRLLDAYPEHPFKDRAEYYLPLTQAMQEKFADANAGFSRWLKTPAYRTNVLQPDVCYWRAVSLLFGGDHSNALDALAAFVSAYPQSSYTADARYRIGVAHYMLGRYKDAAIALVDFTRIYTNHAMIWEARVLRGDALAALGELVIAVSAYRDVGPQSGAYYHYAVAQQGKCLKMLEDYTNMVALYEAYVATAADSPGVVEGVYWLGWAHRQLGNTAAARDVYWQCMARHGNRRDWSNFDALVRELGALYPGSNGLAEFMVALEDEQATARSRGLLTLGARLHMALSHTLARQGATNDLAELNRAFAARYSEESLGADGLAFLAGIERAAGRDKDAAAHWARIATVFSNAPQRAEAELRLAQYTRLHGEPDKAARLLTLAETHAGDVAILVECAVERADLLLAAGQPRDAMAKYEEVLANRAARGPLWPRALLGLGAACEDLRDYRKAIPYYQRIYVLYAAYPVPTAQAYYRSGRCFERLGMVTEAANSYRELLDDQRLAAFDETKLARERLAALTSTAALAPSAASPSP